jgi:hypothetical protein
VGDAGKRDVPVLAVPRVELLVAWTTTIGLLCVLFLAKPRKNAASVLAAARRKSRRANFMLFWCKLFSVVECVVECL